MADVGRTPSFEYACQAFDAVSEGDGWRVVGAGPGSLWTARDDYHAWKRDGYAVRIVCREIQPWVVTDQTMSPVTQPARTPS